MRPLVMDASAGLKLLRDEAGSAEVSDLVAERPTSPAVVPSLFWLEVVNALARRYRYPAPAILEGVRELQELGIRTLETDAAALVAAVDLMERHDLTAYDACYLALAQSLDADLATADRQLALAAGERAIFIGPDAGIAEAQASYHPRQPTWPSWPDAGAYIAQLRARSA